jgi:type III pantothenate kinase
MLLAIDIGNSAIKFGVFDGSDLTTWFSIPTDKVASQDDIGRRINDRVPKSIDAAIICSVVPEVEKGIAEFIADRYQVEPRFVRSTDELGVVINFSVATTGADRLINCFAAAEKYGVPCIVVSFGTATTIDVVDKNRQYLGGLIAAGMSVSAKALSLAASKLPEVEIKKPESLIAQTTETAIQSGIVYGQTAMIEGLLERVIRELNDTPKVIATGGHAGVVASETKAIDIIDPNLTLNGLRGLYDRAYRNEK